MHSDEYDEFEDAEPEARSGILPESLRKLFVTGMSAVFMTEEGIRNALSDLRLPKDAISALMQQTERSRRELMRVLAEELKRYLRAVDLTGELRKAITGLKIKIDAEIQFEEADDDKPVVTTKVSTARKKSNKKKSEDQQSKN